MRSVSSIIVLLAVSSLANAQSLRGLQSTHESREQFMSDMLTLVNAERAKHGLPKVCYNQKLNNAAQLHAEDQARSNKMSHIGSNGSHMSDRIDQQGFQWNKLAENVAAGQNDVAAVMHSWMNSEGHRSNILSTNKFFGMGYARNPNSQYGMFWTQEFGSSTTESCDDEKHDEQQQANKSDDAPGAVHAAEQPGASPTPETTVAPANISEGPAPAQAQSENPGSVPAPIPGDGVDSHAPEPSVAPANISEGAGPAPAQAQSENSGSVPTSVPGNGVDSPSPETSVASADVPAGPVPAPAQVQSENPGSVPAPAPGNVVDSPAPEPSVAPVDVPSGPPSQVQSENPGSVPAPSPADGDASPQGSVHAAEVSPLAKVGCKAKY